MKLYVGIVDNRDWRVVIREEGKADRPLSPRFDLRNHSPTGFAWGYGGSGPAQLALAMLADAIGDQRAVRLYQQFKFKLIARLRQDEEWTVCDTIVRCVADMVETEVRRIAS